ncbi:AAA family ATPase [Flexivirga caeni]|uniref:MoxR family ATPase n=1 Tax=Flexivirga caeni TaxID=2294115 RepID=A0A3M9MCH9_9MICO|nr:MoxR family ATPase [Flexivirga caeni]RNI22298.1 MoxR family ATPase [Flexivirga caeni]
MASDAVADPRIVPVLGREREVELIQAALSSGTHTLLEGPPGTGKSTLLRAVAAAQHVDFIFVEGNAELTPARLIGHFDPSQILERGYTPDIFIPGPLVEALTTGALLYLEEINRIPEETLNVMLTVLSEGELTVPRYGRIPAADGFAIVAAMNPFDGVGVARLSSALHDRTCRIAVDYQSAQIEEQIVGLYVAGIPSGWRSQVVEVVRRTREHPDIRAGSSVRGAIDFAKLAAALATVRHVDVTDWQVGLDAALTALTGRITLFESASKSAEQVVESIYAEVFGVQDDPQDPSDGGDPAGEAGARS